MLALLNQVLKKLRKLTWAENEAYLVRMMLKAVKGRFSQVPQVASLASGLSRYHPSLGVAFVDALLEEVGWQELYRHTTASQVCGLGRNDCQPCLRF